MSLLVAKQEPTEERFIVSIDSRDRDMVRHPNQNSYQVSLPSEYRSIKQIKMLSAEFCNLQYAITSNNNRIVMKEDPTPVAAPLLTGMTTLIREGNYTGTQFAAEIQQTVNADLVTAGSGANIHVTYDMITRKLSFTDNGGPGVMTFLLDSSKVGNAQNAAPLPDNTVYPGGDNLMWREMGFTDLSADLVISAIAAAPTVPPEQVHIFRDRYCIMEIANPKILRGAMRTTRPHFEVFAKIVFDDEPGHLFGNFYHFVSSPMVFLRVMRLSNIAFRFKRPNGEMVDFHNHEHSFTLEIISG
jgi:hypothetical protein